MILSFFNCRLCRFTGKISKLKNNLENRKKILYNIKYEETEKK